MQKEVYEMEHTFIYYLQISLAFLVHGAPLFESHVFSNLLPSGYIPHGIIPEFCYRSVVIFF